MPRFTDDIAMIAQKTCNLQRILNTMDKVMKSEYNMKINDYDSSVQSKCREYDQNNFWKQSPPGCERILIWKAKLHMMGKAIRKL